MNGMIARSDDASKRIFSSISPNMYSPSDTPDNLTPDQRVARDILALANQDFSVIQRLRGWRLDTSKRVGRLLYLHKLGIEAELEGKWQRADYFWSLVREEMRSLMNKTDAWQAVVETVANRPRVFVLNDPVQLRQYLVDEVFIDVHCAFYNGYVVREPDLAWESRAFSHLEHIKELLSFSSLSPDEAVGLLCPALELWLGVCEKSEQWDQAIRVCADLLDYRPDIENYQSRLAKLHMMSTLARRKEAKSPKAHLKDAATLQEGINHLQQMHRAYPYNIAVFEALGILYHQHAVSLANGKRLSDALLSAQKALTYFPSLNEAKKTRDKLVQMMVQLQAQMRTVQNRLRYQPRARLTAEGLRLSQEAQRGFGAFKRYAESQEARKVVETFYAAQGRYVWRDVGLAEPADNWDELAQVLLVSMSKIIGEPPRNPTGLSTAWDQVVTEQKKLAGLDAALICAYLERRLFDDRQSQRKEPAPIAWPAPRNPPVMARVPSKRRLSSDPFLFWLFNSRDTWVKVQAAIAAVLILVVGGLTIRDYWARRTRNIAYEQIAIAAENHDYERLIESAEMYLSTSLFSGKDGRDERVLELYDQAFVRWFARLEGNLDDTAQAHIKRYEALVVDSE